MTKGQEKAIRELELLSLIGGDSFQIISSPIENDRIVTVSISLRLGAMQKKQGGLVLREREEFIVIIPPDFPFERPSITVNHNRFAGFPHVIWSKWLCIYQSQIEWNPADGLFGFFDRLALWFGKAALNDMDPLEGPLEPPHHNTDFSQLPFIIKSNSPIGAGNSWFGLAELNEFSNRVELVGWNDLSGELVSVQRYALAIILPKPLPMEFPTMGKEFFSELERAGIRQSEVVKYLALAALSTPNDKPIHLVLGLPMRRSADGATKTHIAVWSTNSDMASSLKAVLPVGTDSEQIKELREGLSQSIYKVFELSPIKWCPILDDRSEILVRRDSDRPLSWFAGKSILILGCGAIGSWVTEAIVRTKPKQVDLVDNSIVKPGVLLRQNFVLDDVGRNKAVCLAQKVRQISNEISVNNFGIDAHKFLTDDLVRINNYDIVIDCTASSIFQMKLERDWKSFEGKTPLMMSLVIDSSAEKGLCVFLSRGSTGGIWDGYVRLKQKLCVEEHRSEIISAFYSERATKSLFQPEPGCSEPTFRGSTADVFGLVATAINIAITQNPIPSSPSGVIFSNHWDSGKPGIADIIELPKIEEIIVSNYRIRVLESAFRQSRSWVKSNNRINSPNDETGGLLWGFWDDAIQCIWIFNVSGPPSDSTHESGMFICGIEGTVKDHEKRFKRSYGMEGFLGFWHTHPEMSSRQSVIDLGGMTELVSRFGQKQKKALMLIYGRRRKQGTASFHIYQSNGITKSEEFVSVGVSEINLKNPVV